MDNFFNSHKSLAYNLSNEYEIDIETAKEYLKQLIHCYFYLNPQVTFKDFFNLMTNIFVTLI